MTTLNVATEVTLNDTTTGSGDIYQAGTANSVNAAASGGGGGSGNYEVDVYANGISVLANANLNFINSTSMNSYVVANGSTQVNVSFNVNTTMNLVSLNVSANIQNANNLYVTNNTNTAYISVGTLANTVNLNVSSNIFSQSVNVTGNITVQNNIFVPNSAELLFGGTAGNIANANMAMTWNVTANSLDFDATNGGSPGTPGFFFGSETNTGMYLVASGSNTIGFSCNANGVMNISQTSVNVYSTINAANLVVKTGYSGNANATTLASKNLVFIGGICVGMS